MKSGQRILAVLAGAAMLAMPMTAAAAGFNRNTNNYSRPSGGFHASAPRTFAASRSFSAPRTNFSAPRAANFAAAPRTFNFAPTPAPARAAFAAFKAPQTAAPFRSFKRVTTPAVPVRPVFATATRFNAPVAPTVWNRQPVAAPPITPYYGNYNNGAVCDADGDNCQPGYGYGAPAVVRVGHHREPDADDYYEGNGYYGGGAPVVCDEDGDDCVPGGYYQGTSYGPSSYYFEQGPGESLPGYLQHLIYARQMAWIKYQNALARGDRKGAKHLYNAYVSLGNRIARVEARLGGYNYGAAAVPPPVAYASPVAPSPLTSLFGGGTGYPNYGYNPALGSNPAYGSYGYNGYNNPSGYGGNGLTTMLGPLLQQFIP